MIARWQLWLAGTVWTLIALSGAGADVWFHRVFGMIAGLAIWQLWRQRRGVTR